MEKGKNCCAVCNERLRRRKERLSYIECDIQVLTVCGKERKGQGKK